MNFLIEIELDWIADKYSLMSNIIYQVMFTVII